MPPNGENASSRAGLRFGKIDTEAEQALEARFAIRRIPTLALVEKGKEIARTTGAMPENALLQWIDTVMAARGQHRPADVIPGTS